MLLDLLMPEMDCFELLTVVRGVHRLEGLPIIVITGADLSAEERERLTGGVQHIIEKSAYTGEALVKEVRQLVNYCIRR